MNELFLQLVRLGIGHEAKFQAEALDWLNMKDIAERHGLFAVILDGIEKLPSNIKPPQEVLLEWIGEVIYKESMWSSFWYGIWGHLLKPNSI